MSIAIKEVVASTDPDIRALSRLMLETFADPNVVLSEDRLLEFLGLREPDRSFHALVAKDGDQVVGGVVFSYVAPSRCGFSEYLVVGREHRRRGVGRSLAAARRSLLDDRARQSGVPGARGVFIEVESPERTPAEILELDRGAALDAWERWRVFHRLGFFRTSVPYVQPPLGTGKLPVSYLDLLFAPWDEAAIESRRVPPDWIIETIRPIWRGWVPDRYQEFLDWLQHQVGGRAVELLPLFPESSRVE